MYGYIYKITNNINNKFYVGQKKSPVFVESYWGSGALISAAIKKYGKENFTRSILEWCDSAQELNDREIFWIAELNACELGYNLVKGGCGTHGYHHTLETKLKIISNQPDFSGKNNPMYGVHRFGKDAPRYGAKLEQETKDKISNTLLNYYELVGGVSEETKRKQSEARSGKPKTDKHKQQISKSLKGKPKSAEHRAHLSDAAKLRVLHNICQNCGVTFDAKGWKQKYCETCKELLSKEHTRVK